ncbi:MAG: hypothetical protein COR54_02250 [Elusimicrobia bacterium CG22_combo_CG10-13_8_21_14_all_63_91]|nr:MAG: hypothetical protein COR54_02250 [Elusimicrobia bacterium CG22_combo_CG10-13_8_21_14_all_63_91]PJA14706.1 MAG: hypothetical protein COX66_11875 [Elusimicrobia bacterium CG_4_10_14_0_2_um_filter_63_34]
MARLTLIEVEDLLQVGLDDLKRLWVDLPEIYRDALVKHPKTPALLLWHAAMSNRYWTFRVGDLRDDIPSELVWDWCLHILLDFGNDPWGFGRHPSLGVDHLAVLTELGGLNCRSALLFRQDIADEALERLSRDPHRDIRRRAVKLLRGKRGVA